MATTRTLSKYVRFIIKDSGATLREVPVNKIGNVGLIYPQVDLTAFQDAVKGFAPGIPDAKLTFGGPFDTSAAVAAAASGATPALSGSHTILNAVNGLLTPLSWAIYIGMGRYWSTGDPVFGISSSSTAGVLVTNYQVLDASGGLAYTADLVFYPGSTAPA